MRKVRFLDGSAKSNPDEKAGSRADDARRSGRAAFDGLAGVKPARIGIEYINR